LGTIGGYTVTVDDPDADVSVNGSIVTVTGLATGDRTFTVTGYVGGVAVAEGTKTVTINAGEDTSATVILGPIVGNGPGTFSYTVDLSGVSDATGASSLTVTAITGGTVPSETGGGKAITSGKVLLTLNTENSDTISLPAGTYLLSVSISADRGGGTDNAKFSNEVIHVYTGLTSAFTRVYTNNDFVKLLLLDGLTLSFTAPVKGALAADSSILDTAQYRVDAIVWTGANEAGLDDGKFKPGTVYTATVTLRAQPGYTFDGIPEDGGGFTFSGGAPGNPSITNDAGEGNEITVAFEFEATEKSPAQDLVDDLGLDSDNVDLVDEWTVVLKGDAELTGDRTIPDDVTLKTDEYTLTVTGTLTVPKTSAIVVDGVINVNGVINVEGALVLEADSKGILNGTVTVLPGGVSRDLKAGGGTLWDGGSGTGSYVFEAGALAYVALTEGSDTEGTLIIGTNSDAQTTLTKGTITLTKTSYTLDSVDDNGGEATLNGPRTIAAGDTVTVGTGSTLTIGSNANLTVANRGVLNVEGEIVVAENGGLVLALGSEGILNGTITVKEDGVSKDLNPGGSTLWDGGNGTGKYVFEAGAEAYVALKGVDDPTGTLIIDGSGNSAPTVLTAGTLTLTKTGYTLDGDGVNGGEATINGPRTIAADDTVTVKPGSKLTIGSSGNLTVAEHGVLNVEGTIEVDGELVLNQGASGDLDGTIKVNSTGVSKDLKPNGGTLWGDDLDPGTGTYVFAAGARAYVGGDDDDDLLIGRKEYPPKTTWIQLASGTFSNTKDAFVLDGVATVRTSFGLNSGQKLTIKDKGKLTVEIMSTLGNPIFSPYVYLIVFPDCKIIGEGNAVIEAKAPVGENILNGNIYFFGNGEGSTNANFYDSNANQG
jgi:hypothetical protein